MTTTTTISTPTVRKAGRLWLFWILAGLVAVMVALGSLAITGAVSSAGVPLSPTDSSPQGSKALAEVLRQQGVTVTATDSMVATRMAASNPATTTIFVVDDGHYLSGAKLQELRRLSSHIILMTPDFDQLDAFAPEVALAGNVSGVLTADCSLRPVEQAGTVTGTGSGYRNIGADPDVVTCLGSGDSTYSLIQSEHAGTTVTIIGTTEAFTNQFVVNEGNAAFALGLLGGTKNLVWLLPSIDEAGGALSAADLTPAWVSLVMILLIISTIAAGFWRGRRFGPLVVENLPVVVRASETMHGRARLYEKSTSRLHALDALRIGTIDRVGVRCGLPTVASVDDVIRTVSALLRRPEPEIAQLLRDADPSTEAELVRLSDALLDLERAVAAATGAPSTTIDPTQQNTEPGE
jgi:uncharacterized protein DUF4350